MVITGATIALAIIVIGTIAITMTDITTGIGIIVMTATTGAIDKS